MTSSNHKHTCFQILSSIFVLTTLMFLSGCSMFESDDEKFKMLTERAEKFIGEGKFDEARISLQSAQQLKPKHAETYFRLAEVLVRLKKFPKAVENYRGTLELNPNHIGANLHLASMLLIGGEPELAESHVNKVLEIEPDNLNALAVFANVHSRRRNFDDAEKVLDQILTKDPKHVGALTGKADTALARKDFPEAEKYLQKALEIEPGNSPIQLAMIDLYTRQGRYDDAQALLGNLVDKQPENSSLRYYFAEFLLTKGSTTDSIDQFEKTVVGLPEKYTARDRLYDLYIFKQEFDKAKGLTADLASKKKDNSALPYFEGRNLDLDGKTEEALKKYLEAMDALPHFAPVFRRAGVAEMALGKTDEAIQHLNQAIAISEHDVGARIALAQHEFKQANYSASTEHVKKVLERYPRQIGANILYADLALVDGNVDTAQKIYDLLVKSFPKSPTGYLKLGLLEERKKNPSKAIENYRTALDKDIEVWLPLRRFATLSSIQNGKEKTIEEVSSLREKSERAKAEYSVVLAQLALTEVKDKEQFASAIKEARAYLDQAIGHNDQFLPAYTLMAQLDASEGKLEDAIGKYKKLIELNPKTVQYRTLLAMTFEHLGEFDQAASTYKEILEISPRFGVAANNLAWLMAENLGGNLDEALKLALIAKEELPKHSAVADTLGWIYHKKGSSRAALQLIEEAVSIETEENDSKVNPEILFHLSTVRKALGNIKGAKAALDKALKLGGEKFGQRAEIQNLLKDLT